MSSKTDNATFAGTRPEALLLLEAIAARRSPEGRGRVEALLEEAVDWNRLLSLAERHGLMPLLYACLSELGSRGIPEDVLEKLRRFYYQNRFRNMALLKELLEILRVFEANGIRAIPLKGPLLANRIYGNPGLRWIADLDIFVRRDDILKAAPLLQRRGYRPDKDPSVFQDRTQWEKEWEWGFDNHEKGIRVEIQWRTMPEHSADYECLDEGVWDRAETTVLGGVEILTLSLEDVFLYACFHGGGKHLWCDMRFLADMGRMLECDWEIDWEEVRARAAKMRKERTVALALYLAVTLGGATLPAALEEKIRFTPYIDAMAGLVRGRLFREDLGLPGYREWLRYTRLSPPPPAIPPGGLRKAAGRMLLYIRAVLTPEFGDRAGPNAKGGLRFLAYLYRPYRLFRRHGPGIFRRLG